MSEEELREELPEIRELGSAPCSEQIHCLTIAGQIEGHTVLPSSVKTTKYEHLMPLLAAIEESPELRGLLILLNTVGGDVEAGLGIAELIAGVKTPTASLVLGGGHSIGLPIAAAASRSFIALTAAVTVHPVRLTGVVIGVPQTYSYLARVQDRILRFITEHSRISREKLTELMLKTGELAGDVGSILEGEEAVALGLIDQVGGLADALEYLHGRIKEQDGIPP